MSVWSEWSLGFRLLGLLLRLKPLERPLMRENGVRKNWDVFARDGMANFAAWRGKAGVQKRQHVWWNHNKPSILGLISGSGGIFNNFIENQFIGRFPCCNIPIINMSSKFPPLLEIKSTYCACLPMAFVNGEYSVADYQKKMPQRWLCRHLDGTLRMVTWELGSTLEKYI